MSDEQEKRPTVCVTCGIPNGLQIALHQVHEGFVGQKTRVPIGDIITLQGGDNPGIDREWFGMWLEENSQLSLVTGGQISWRDEKPAEASAPEDRGPVFAQPQSEPDSIEEMRQPGDLPPPETERQRSEDE